MRVRFWGVRGSIPSPGPKTVRYGGNTPCVEISCGEETLIIDAGTGIRELGFDLMRRAAGGPVILFLALAGLPWSWRELRRDRGGAPRSTPDRPVFLLVVAAEVPTAELCLAWRRSYLSLLDLPPGPARDRVVSLRRELLDELERRDRAGFGRWIDTGARAGSDPGRYLSTDR